MLTTILSLSLLILNVLDTLKLLKRPKTRTRKILRTEDGQVAPIPAKRRISTLKRDQMRGMLMLWVTWTFTRLVIVPMDTYLSWIPFYSYFTSSIFIYLLLTRSLGGGIIYRRIISPNLDKYSQPIDLVTELILLLLRWNIQLVLLVTLVPLMAIWEWIDRRIRPSQLSPGEGKLMTPTSAKSSQTPPKTTITSNLLALGRSTPHFSQALSEARAIFNTIEGRQSDVRGKAEELKRLRDRSTIRKKVVEVGGRVEQGRVKEGQEGQEDVDVEEELRLDSIKPTRQRAGPVTAQPKLSRPRPNAPKSNPSRLSTIDVPSIYPQVPKVTSSTLRSTLPEVSPRRSSQTRMSNLPVPAIRQEMKNSHALLHGNISPMVPGGFRFNSMAPAAGGAPSFSVDEHGDHGIAYGDPQHHHSEQVPGHPQQLEQLSLQPQPSEQLLLHPQGLNESLRHAQQSGPSKERRSGIGNSSIPNPIGNSSLSSNTRIIPKPSTGMITRAPPTGKRKHVPQHAAPNVPSRNKPRKTNGIKINATEDDIVISETLDDVNEQPHGDVGFNPRVVSVQNIKIGKSQGNGSLRKRPEKAEPNTIGTSSSTTTTTSTTTLPRLRSRLKRPAPMTIDERDEAILPRKKRVI